MIMTRSAYKFWHGKELLHDIAYLSFQSLFSWISSKDWV